MYNQKVKALLKYHLILNGMKLTGNVYIWLQIRAGESTSHEITFVFLCDGQYKLDMTCSGVKHQPVTAQNTDNMQQPISTKDTAADVQTWKSTPAIEINITHEQWSMKKK